jgi:primosomal protein N' (replication factor Y)
VILQTYLPDHPVIAALGRQDSARFYAFELESRRMLGYPPFVHLINLRVTGIDRAKVEHAASDWRNRLTRDSSSAVSVLGPVPGMVAQLRGRHRYQLLVKSQDPDALRRTVRRTVDDLERLPRHGLKYEVDVDPVELA